MSDKMGEENENVTERGSETTVETKGSPPFSFGEERREDGKRDIPAKFSR